MPSRTLAFIAFIVVCCASYASAVSNDPLLRRSLLAYFAPIVHLNQYDHWRPADPQQTYRIGFNGQHITIPQSIITGNPVVNGAVSAPVTAQIRDVGSYTYLQYWFYYNNNGCQNFNLSSPQLAQPINFEWCNISLHYGDWEHVTIQLNRVVGNLDIIALSLQSFLPPVLKNLLPSVRQVAYSQHSGVEWVPKSKLTFRGSHVDVYSAINSHANHPDPFTRPNTDEDTQGLVDQLTAPFNAKVVLIDQGQADSNQYFSLTPADTSASEVLWNTWNNIYDFSATIPAWGKYTGTWGQSVDDTSLSAPSFAASTNPDIQSLAEGFLLTLQGAIQQGFVPDSFISPNTAAPPGPVQHDAWIDLDNPLS